MNREHYWVSNNHHFSSTTFLVYSYGGPYRLFSSAFYLSFRTAIPPFCFFTWGGEGGSAYTFSPARFFGVGRRLSLGVSVCGGNCGFAELLWRGDSRGCEVSGIYTKGSVRSHPSRWGQPNRPTSRRITKPFLFQFAASSCSISQLFSNEF